MKTKISLFCFLSCMAFGQYSMRIDGDVMTVTMQNRPSYFGRAVTGAPYSGEQTSEHIQTLADGTHITQPQNGSQKMFRDSQGRTRTERSMGGMMPGQKGKFIMVEIEDPVSMAHYVIDDSNKVVHRMALTPMAERPRPAVTTRTPEQIAAAAKNREEYKPEKLGPENIEGVIAEGTRSSRTIPIGEVGNDRPIVTSSDSWFSTELKLMVLSKYSDPRNGDNTTKVINISRAEPDASLFLPPAGYAVVDEKESFTFTIKKQ